MTTRQVGDSGVRVRAGAIPKTPNDQDTQRREFLGAGLEAALSCGMLDGNTLVDVVTERAVLGLLWGSADIRRMHLANSSPLTNLDEVSSEFTLLLAQMAHEERKLALGRLIEVLPPCEWSAHFNQTWIWQKGILRNAWWKANPREAEYAHGCNFMTKLINAAVEQRVVTADELKRMLGGTHSMYQHAERANAHALKNRLMTFVTDGMRSYSSDEQVLEIIRDGATTIYDLDELYLKVLIPLGNKCEWDEPVTQPDLKPLSDTQLQVERTG